MTKKTTDVVVPAPTLTLHAQTLSVNITSQLYGEVTPERKAREQAILQHRIEQLMPVQKRSRQDDYTFGKDDYTNDY